MAMPETLWTKRLSLRLLDPDDLDVVHSLFSSPGHTIGDGPVGDRAETLGWLERRRRLHRENGLAWYGLRDREKFFVGSCGVFLGDRCGDEPEIGYEIDLPQRRRGYAREAAGVVTQAAHAAGHVHVWATIRPANLASVRIARAIGYHLFKNESDSKAGPSTTTAMQSMARPEPAAVAS